MISIPLFKRETKANWLLVVIFIAVLSLYVSVIASMFNPSMGNILQSFSESMPELMNAFGMGANAGATTLLGFLSTYLYSMLLIIFPMLFEIILANKLVAKYVDRGSMAYLLASPNKRSKIVFTQALFLFLCVFLLIFYAALLGFISCQASFPGQLDVAKYFYLNLGLLCLHIGISGLCFFASCLFNDTKWSYAIGTGIPVAFLLLQMMANMGGKLDNLKYFTAFTLYNPNSIILGASKNIWMCAILFIGGIVLYIAGIIVFSKRDLPV